MDNNKDKEIQAFSNFIAQEAKAKGKDPKSYAKELGEEGLKEAYKRFQASKQKQAKKALHGAKLNYFKSLKNQCAEDEEVVYYKKGGLVSCGCKKKEDGGQVKKDCGGSAIAKFKAQRMQSGGKKTVSSGKSINSNTEKKEGWDNKGNYIVTKKGIAERKKQLEANKNEEGQADPKKQETKPQTKPVAKKACGSKIKKHQEGSVIAQFKAHRQGGKLQFAL